jgi:hypothetical protein
VTTLGDTVRLPAATQAASVVNSIHDRDTLRVTCAGEALKIRLYCIDPPEMAQHPWGQESRDHLRRVALREVGLLERDILLNNDRIRAGGSSVRSVLRRARRVSTLRWSRPGRRRIHGTARIRRFMRRIRGHGRQGAGFGRTKGRSSLGRRGGEVRRVACAWPRRFVNRVTPETGRIAGRPVTEHASQDPIPETVNDPDLSLDAAW